MQSPNPIIDDLVRSLVIAIDGPAGSGKSTTAKLVAGRLGIRHIDTGAMYRAITLAAMRDGVDPSDADGCTAVAARADLRLGYDGDGVKVWLGEDDVTAAIRTPEVTGAVSAVSAHPGVRAALVRRQRRMSDEGGAVLEGRDIGTVVLPGADVKVYIDASAAVRAERRRLELANAGVEKSLQEMEADIIERDRLDSSREVSPLRRAVGAFRVDTSALTIEEQVEAVVTLARQAARRELERRRPPEGNPPALSFRGWYRLPWSILRLLLFSLWGYRIRSMVDFDLNENYIFASNHVSNYDPPVVGSTVHRELFFLAKPGLFTNRVFGGWISSYNAIPLRRGVFDRETMAQALQMLQAGRSTLIFPEAGRIKSGRLGKPRSGVGYLAINSGVTVVPIYVRGTDSLWKSLWRRGRVAVLHGRPIRIDGIDREEFKNNDGYRDFSEMVMEAIAALRDEMDHPSVS